MQLLVEVGKAGMVAWVNVCVAAGQAEQEVRPAAPVRGRPGAGAGIRAIRRRRLLVSGIRLFGEAACEDDGPGLFQGLLGAVFEDGLRGALDVLVGQDVDALVGALGVLQGPALTGHRRATGPLERGAAKVVPPGPDLRIVPGDPEDQRAYRERPVEVPSPELSPTGAGSHQQIGARGQAGGQRPAMRSRLHGLGD